MAGGRPRIFDSEENMQHIIDLYYLACKRNSSETDDMEDTLNKGDKGIIDEIEDVVPTISGLAYTLGMTTETFRTYGLDDKFSATVKRAKQRVEMSLEQRLAGHAVTGSIFSLKNNFGWKDKTEVDTTSSVTINMPDDDANTL